MFDYIDVLFILLCVYLLSIIFYNTYSVVVRFFIFIEKYFFELIVCFYRTYILNIYLSKIHRNIKIYFEFEKIKNWQAHKRHIRGSPRIRGDPRMQWKFLGTFPGTISSSPEQHYLNHNILYFAPGFLAI